MDFSINTSDRKIFASKWDSPGDGKILIIAPGIGVSRHFYRKFAEYFSNLKYTVITFDYVKNEPTDEKVHLKDWGEKDIHDVIWYCRDHYPEKPVFFVGHSIAGQLFPLAGNSNLVSSGCFIASQNISISNWKGIYRLKLQLFWNFIIPFFVYLRGNLPKYAYGGGFDLPSQVATDWADWSKSRLGLVEKVEYAQEAYNTIRVPVKFFSIANDHLLAPEHSVKVLHSQYGSSAKNLEHIDPRKYGLKKMGHFDFFRSEFSFLWPKIDRWFQKTT